MVRNLWHQGVNSTHLLCTDDMRHTQWSKGRQRTPYLNMWTRVSNEQGILAPSPTGTVAGSWRNVKKETRAWRNWLQLPAIRFVSVVLFKTKCGRTDIRSRLPSVLTGQAFEHSILSIGALKFSYVQSWPFGKRGKMGMAKIIVKKFKCGSNWHVCRDVVRVEGKPHGLLAIATVLWDGTPPHGVPGQQAEGYSCQRCPITF